MNSLSIALLDSDRAYMEKLVAAVRRLEGTNRYYFRLFSYSESLDAIQQDLKGSHVLLIDSKCQLNPRTASRFPCVIVLTEHCSQDQSTALDTSDSYPSLFKFQPVAALLSEIEQLYRERIGKHVHQQQGMKVWTVFSMSGGSGKTTLALQLARELANRHRRPFYWPADFGSSAGEVFHGGSPEGWANTFYYVKSGAKQLPAHWLEPVRQDPVRRMFYKESIMSWRDWLELTPPELDRFLKLMREQNLYEDLICDAGSSLCQKTVALMQNSDRILWLVNDSRASLNRARYAIEQVRKETESEQSEYRIDPERITFVVNKYSGRRSEELRQFPERIAALFPYIQELDGFSLPEYSSEAMAYEESMKGLVDKFLS
jgi:cellulose biosynthesis protein BcsQ